MLCLINAQEKQYFIDNNQKNIEIIFVNNENEFKEYLYDNVFPVISVNNIDNMAPLISSFPNIRFFLFYQDVGELPLPSQAYSILLEPNISPDSKKRSVFNANELVALFDGQDITD